MRKRKRTEGRQEMGLEKETKWLILWGDKTAAVSVKMTFTVGRLVGIT